MKDQFKSKLIGFREAVIAGLLSSDPSAQLKNDSWTHKTSGGGVTSVVTGEIFERAGVAFSDVKGTLTADIAKHFGASGEVGFEAFGTSLIIHPRSARVPTVHANLRYLEIEGKSWVGGGTDLTPYVLNAEDAIHFHRTLKGACERHSSDYYPKFKKWCDEYFFLPHRGETRGVGGIFFDYLGRDEGSASDYFSFAGSVADVFCESYFPIVEKHKAESPTAEETRFQKLRRGRYVEFNLLYDRGTLFGLKSGGRTESILMSMPPEVSWEYNFEPPEGSNAAELMQVLRAPRAWV